MLIPTTPCDENMAPSTLTLNIGAGGGVHKLLNSSLGLGSLGDAVAAVNSASTLLPIGLFHSFFFFASLHSLPHSDYTKGPKLS